MWDVVNYMADDAEQTATVAVENPNDNKCYWVDVWITDQDVEADWNQYIFYLTDLDDVTRQEAQADPDNFDEATSTAICYLESENIIYQDNNGNWFWR